MRDSFSDWYKKLVLIIFYSGFIAEVNGRTAGFIIPRIKRGIGEIYLIAVDKRFRETGVGSKLLECGLEYLIEREVINCIAWVKIDNKRAEKLYSKMGFKKMEGIIKKRIIGEDLCLWSLHLNGQRSKAKLQGNVQINKYPEKRLKSRGFKYRLRRRTDEVLVAIRTFGAENSKAVLDIGATEGSMLNSLNKNLNVSLSVGVDLSIEGFKLDIGRDIKFLRNDATKLPFKENVFDIVIATAVIEHLPSVNKTLKEIHSVCKKNGICIISTSDPFFDKIATRIGYYGKGSELHIETFTISKLKILLESNGFKILRAEKFMVSPIGFPFEKRIEKIVKKLKLDFLLCNQIIVAQKIVSI